MTLFIARFKNTYDDESNQWFVKMTILEQDSSVYRFLRHNPHAFYNTNLIVNSATCPQLTNMCIYIRGSDDQASDVAYKRFDTEYAASNYINDCKKSLKATFQCTFPGSKYKENNAGIIIWQ